MCTRVLNNTYKNVQKNNRNNYKCINYFLVKVHNINNDNNKYSNTYNFDTTANISNHA